MQPGEMAARESSSKAFKVTEERKKIEGGRDIRAAVGSRYRHAQQIWLARATANRERETGESVDKRFCRSMPIADAAASFTCGSNASRHPDKAGKAPLSTTAYGSKETAQLEWAGDETKDNGQDESRQEDTEEPETTKIDGKVWAKRRAGRKRHMSPYNID